MDPMNLDSLLPDDTTALVGCVAVGVAGVVVAAADDRFLCFEWIAVAIVRLGCAFDAEHSKWNLVLDVVELVVELIVELIVESIVELVVHQ